MTITGSHFCNGTTTVNFGATAATNVVVVSDTQVTATSPAHAAGTVDVTVTNAGGTSATTPADHFTYGPGPCTSVNLVAAPPSPQPSGTQVTLTASASGCPNPVYEFWARWQGTTTWQMLQSYSSSNSYVWNSTGAAPGTEYFGVWARDASSSASYDAITSIAYTVGPALPPNQCTAVSISAVPTTVIQGSGTHVTLTASGTCPNPNPAYEFWARWAGTGTWVLVQSYSTKATYDWDSTGAAPGVENFGVWVRDVSSSAAYDANNSTQVTVSPAVCPNVTIVAVPNTVVGGAGTHVTLTANAPGCTGIGPFYKFWMRSSTSTTWTMLRDYSTTATYDWNSTGAPSGTYFFGVWAKDGHSTNGYDSTASTTVTVG